MRSNRRSTIGLQANWRAWSITATGVQYLSIRYTERLAKAGIEPSVGSVGDSYDNALAETVIGLYKTELIRQRGPWRGLEDVEFRTLEWVAWFNNHRFLEPIGHAARRVRGDVLSLPAGSTRAGGSHVIRSPENPDRFTHQMNLNEEPYKKVAERAADAIALALERIGPFLDDSDRIRPGSQAESEANLLGQSWQSDLRDAHSEASLMTEAVADHLSGFVAVLAPPAAKPFAACTCLRGAMEAASLAVWLSDDSIDGRARVQRWFAIRLDGLEQQKKFARVMHRPERTLLQAEERIQRVRERGRTLGFDIQASLPGKTDLCRALGAEAFYRLSSAVAHGQHWALTEVGFKKVQARGDGMFLMEKRVNPLFTAWMALAGWQAIDYVTEKRAMLFGYTDSLARLRMQIVRDSGLEEIGDLVPGQ